jgi:2-oxoisovalerate dehydrogenase E1 component alpha subunit
MEARGWWNAEEEEALKARLKADVMRAFKRAEAVPRHELGELFTDVYAGEEPWNIVSASLFDDFGGLTDWLELQREQRNELTGLLKKYGQAWEPWRTELAKFKNGGKDLTQSGA